MITLELEDVEIDYCTECGGIWLDAGELELLLGEPHKAKQLLGSFEIESQPTERIRNCPICNKKMQKVKVGSSTPVLLIDKCHRGDGLWFDRGELNDICDRAQLDEDNKIKKLLKEIFSHNQD